ncbi:MAG: glycosyltransferase family 2 protein [bacterium]|nr:glycosyltransferase family 2 protein [bacterium]MDD5354289.1 glycosyltransferase family 2 protein [bacterium]
MKPEISVFFPCYNEEANIKTTVTKAIAVLAQFTDIFEVIIVDDGSTDKTGDIAAALAQDDQRVRVWTHESNRGYGAALRSGFTAAKYDIVCFTDADGQFDLSEISQFLPLIAKYDAVLGYRLKRQDKFYRKINTFIYKTAVNLFFRLGVRDIDCAFKMFRREVMNSITIESDGAVASAEMLIKAKRTGCRFVEVGVHHYPRLAGQPTGAKLGVIFKAFAELFKLFQTLK